MIVGVLGAGAWGTALAMAAARAENTVILCGRDDARMNAIERTRENAASMPDVFLAPSIRATADASSLESAELILVAVPAQSLRETLVRIGATLRLDVPIVICAKGIERDSGCMLSDVVRSLLPRNPPMCLSGPSFAADVGRGLPTAVTLAADTSEMAAAVAAMLASPAFRLYHTDDLRGVEIGGAVKNVLAIACGIAQGRGLGASAVAALMARAFAELLRYGRASAARPETLMGLSGFGDLVLTCSSVQSRNFSLGLALGRGVGAAGGGGPLAEGVATAPVLLDKARHLGIDMPIVENVVDILARRVEIDGAIEALLARPIRSEQ